MTNPNLNNLADKYAEIKIKQEALEEQLKALKEEISSVAPVVGKKTAKGWKLDGDYFAVTVSVQSRNTIDEKLLAEKFGLTAEQINSCKRESVFDVIRYKAIAV